MKSTGFFFLLVALGGSAAAGCPARHTGSGEATTSPPPGAEAVSLTGAPLMRPAMSDEARQQAEQRLAEARAIFERDPRDADAAIWLGRRTAYLGRFQEAIAIYTSAIAVHPNDARLYRHRGHRYITTRQLEKAVADLAKAASLTAGKQDEIEPDGIPNARNIPTSTLQSNIWYHLGLSHYLRGDFERALRAYREDLKVATNPDMLVATSHWLYMTLRRLGRESDAAAVLAPISHDMDIIENGAYHRLLLMYKGDLPADSVLAAPADGDSAVNDATVGYGVANWHLYNGRRAEAEQLFRQILRSPQWAAFGYIAAEADMARMTRR